MRLKFIALIFSLFAAVILKSGNICRGSNEQPAKRETVRLTAAVLRNELREDIETRAIEENLLYNEMKVNSQEHVSREGSWKLLEQVIKESFREWYETEVQRILDRLDSDRPENLKSWFSEDDRKNLKQFPEKALETNLSNNFREVFEKTRKRVCAEQWTNLILDLYPTEKEFESTDRSKLEDILLEQLIERQRKPLFEENKEKLSDDFVGPILDDAGTQLARQKEIVRESGGGGGVPGAIETFIKGELNLYRKELEEKKKGERIAIKVYETFPSVSKIIPEQAKKIAARKFSLFLSESNFPVDQNRLKPFIQKDLEAHTMKAESMELCTAAFRQDIESRAMANYTANTPASQRVEFSRFLENLVSNDELCRNTMNELVERSMEENFEKVRQELKQEQLTQFFKPLNNGTWGPGYDEIEVYDRMPGEIHIKSPLAEDGISNRAFKKEVLLEETLERVSERVDELIKEGLAALKGQMTITENVEKEVKKALEKEKEPLSLGTLIKFFTAKIQAEWKEKRIPFLWSNQANAPENSDTKYIQLFPKVKETIEKYAKAMLHQEIAQREEIKEKQAKQIAAATGKKSEEGGPGGKGPGQGGGGQGGGQGPGEGPGRGKGVRPDVIIDLDYVEEKIETTLIFVKQDFSYEFVLDPKVYEAHWYDIFFDFKKEAKENMNQTMKEITELFEHWLQGSVEKELYVITRIFDGRVYYGIVFNFRQCLRNALISVNKVNNKMLKVYWYDELLEKEDKGTNKVPPDFKERSMSF